MPTSIASKTSSLMDPAFQIFDTYQNYVGQIASLRRVSHSFCEEVNTKMNKRD